MKKTLETHVALADGKSWKQLEQEANRAIDSGMEHWPRVCLQLLRAYKKLVDETAELRQPALFAPSQMSKKEERNGV